VSPQTLHLLEVVDDDFVAAEGAERGLHRRGDGSTGVDVPEYGSIFGVIANGGGWKIRWKSKSPFSMLQRDRLGPVSEDGPAERSN
jgi:hypothetical protein